LSRRDLDRGSSTLDEQRRNLVERVEKALAQLEWRGTRQWRDDGGEFGGRSSSASMAGLWNRAERKSRAVQRYSSFLPTRGEVASRMHAAVDESRRSASHPGRRGHALGHRCPVAHGHCYRTTASTWACRCSALPSLTRAGAGRPQPSINCAATTLPPSAASAAAIRHVHT